MNEIKIFENNQFGKIRVAVNENGELLFCLADICNILNLTNPTMVGAKLDDEDKAKLDLGLAGQRPTYITESGMYTVILRSDSLLAKPMQKWVTKDVIPSIRKTGAYNINNNIPATYLDALKALVISEEAKQLAEHKVQELTPKAIVFDNISNSNTLLSFNYVAKSIGIGRNTMMKTLRDKKILRANNTPYQQHIDNGMFEVKIKPINGLNITQTFVTGKGIVWLSKIINN